MSSCENILCHLAWMYFANNFQARYGFWGVTCVFSNISYNKLNDKPEDQVLKKQKCLMANFLKSWFSCVFVKIILVSE